MKESRITEDVLMRLQNMAREMLRKGTIPDEVDRRDLEILEHSRICEKCGAVYELNDYADKMCPICENEDTETTYALNEIEDCVDDVSNNLDRLEDSIEALKEEIKNLKNRK